MGILETMIDIPAEHEKNVFGQFDIFAKKIERALQRLNKKYPQPVAADIFCVWGKERRKEREIIVRFLPYRLRLGLLR